MPRLFIGILDADDRNLPIFPSKAARSTSKPEAEAKASSHERGVQVHFFEIHIIQAIFAT